MLWPPRSTAARHSANRCSWAAAAATACHLCIQLDCHGISYTMPHFQPGAQARPGARLPSSLAWKEEGMDNVADGEGTNIHPASGGLPYLAASAGKLARRGIVAGQATPGQLP